MGVLRQGFVLLVLDYETICREAVICWGPGEFPIEVVDASFDDWTGLKGDIGLALEQTDRNGTFHTR